MYLVRSSQLCDQATENYQQKHLNIHNFILFADVAKIGFEIDFFPKNFCSKISLSEPSGWTRSGIIEGQEQENNASPIDRRMPDG